MTNVDGSFSFWRSSVSAKRSATIDLKTKLPEIRTDVDNALLIIAKRHGLKSLACGRGTYDPRAGCFTFKLEGVTNGGLNREAVRYKEMGEVLNLPPLDTIFTTHDGHEFKPTGLNTTATKVIAQRLDNQKSYLFPISLVHLYIDKKK